MPVDPNIPLSVQVPQQQNPIQQFSQIEALKGALQQQQVQEAQLEGLNQENAMRATQMQQMKTVNQAYRDSMSFGSDGTPQIDQGKLTKALAANGAGNQIPSVLEGITKYQKSIADLAEVNGKVAAAQADALGNVGGALQKANYDPQLFLTLTQHAIDAKAVNPKNVAGQIQQVQQSLLQDPTGAQARGIVKQIADSAVQMSDTQQKLLNEGRTAQGAADRGTAALQNAATNQQKYLAGERARILGTATDQASWDAGIQTLKKMGDTLDGVPASFSPQAAAALSNSGKTPHEVATETQAQKNFDATQNYRKQTLQQGQQRIGIMQQNADTAEDRLDKPTATQSTFNQREIDKARQQLDQIHQQRTALGAALQTPNGQNYLDPKTGKLSTDEMDDQARAKLQQQYQNVTNQGQRIIQQYGDDKSGGRIRSNELPASGQSGQSGQPTGQSGQKPLAPNTQPAGSSRPGQQKQGGNVAPEGTIISNPKTGQRMQKINGQWKPL